MHEKPNRQMYAKTKQLQGFDQLMSRKTTPH